MMLMFLYIFYLAVDASLATGIECDKHGILLYEDLGCTAQHDSGKKCPTKYSCLGLEPSNKSCYFRGKSYEDKEEVEGSLSSPSCHVGCSCSTKDERPGFTCAILDCLEGLEDPDVSSDCYRNYSLDDCCSVGETCPPFDNIKECVIEGKEYREGEQFYPSNTCLDCVCQKGFTGKLEEPFCKRRRCGEQLDEESGSKIQESCAPFYNGGEVLCCPDDWICSDGSEIIKGVAKSEEICKFGTKTVKVGQQFEKPNFTDQYGRHYAKVKCECVIPPFLTCVKV